MKVQEYIFLIFSAISFWTELIAADIFQPYNGLDIPTLPNFVESIPTETAKFSSDYNSQMDEDIYENVYKYTAKNPDGETVCLDKYAGKVLIIVNYASNCGFTEINVYFLSKLAEKYKAQGLEILIFPSNDFFENYGGDNAAQLFAKDHPEFEVFSEIHVNGEAQHKLYKFLKNKLPGDFNSGIIKWNFTKFVVNKNGCPIKRYSALDSFKDIEEFIQNLLAYQDC